LWGKDRPPVPVRWFRAVPGAKTFPHPCIWDAVDWYGSKGGQEGGDLLGVRGKYDKGVNPGLANGQHFDGPAELFSRPGVWGVDVPITTGINGHPPGCGGNDPIVGPLAAGGAGIGGAALGGSGPVLDALGGVGKGGEGEMSESTAPYLVSAYQSTGSFPTGTIFLNPVGLTDDLILVFGVRTNPGDAWPTMTGWTELDSGDHPSGNMKWKIWYRVRAADSDNYGFIVPFSYQALWFRTMVWRGAAVPTEYSIVEDSDDIPSAPGVAIDAGSFSNLVFAVMTEDTAEADVGPERMVRVLSFFPLTGGDDPAWPIQVYRQSPVYGTTTEDKECDLTADRDWTAAQIAIPHA